jgi:hypothetical protein
MFRRNPAKRGGAVWAVAAQVELARDYAVPRRRSGTASLVSMAVTLVVGLVAAGVTLPMVSAHAVRQAEKCSRPARILGPGAL